MQRRFVLAVSCGLVLALGALACSGKGASDPSGAGGASGAGSGGGVGSGGAPTAPPPRRVVGYLPTYRSLSPSNLDFETLTHLCIAFANPTADGASDFDEGVRASIQPLVDAAHQSGVRVLASIAGGTDLGGGAVAAEIVPERRDAYIASLLALLDRYQLDGIDVDIEGEHVTETYEPFVQALGTALPEGKLLTTAVATNNGAAFSAAALAEYDFINLMAYDACGWSTVPCEHSSLTRVDEELAYWVGERGVPQDKLVLGVPFYGWCWGCGTEQTALTYESILAEYPEAATTDLITDGERTISFNGPTTIAQKAELAQEYGGIMIWELGQDAAGEGSLFRVIAAAQRAD